MTRKLGITTVLCLVLAISFALVGCGSAPVDKSNYTGDWKLASSTDENLDADSIALMQSLGLEVDLTLGEDGTGTLDMFGDESELTWEASSNTEGKVSIDGAESAMKLADGELTLADVNGASLTFMR